MNRKDFERLPIFPDIKISQYTTSYNKAITFTLDTVIEKNGRLVKFHQSFQSHNEYINIHRLQDLIKRLTNDVEKTLQSNNFNYNVIDLHGNELFPKII